MIEYKYPFPINAEHHNLYDPEDYKEFMFSWSRELLIRMGQLSALCRKDERYKPNYNDMSWLFRYGSDYGPLKMFVEFYVRGVFSETQEMKLLSRGREFCTMDTAPIENILLAMLPGVKLSECQSKRACQMPGCQQYDYFPFWYERPQIKNGLDYGFSAYYNWMHDYTTSYFGDIWICDSCREKFLLSNLFDNSSRNETPPQKTEREKMTPSLRLSILERDGFRCRACGRDPRKDDVTLHVDHIVPIAKGGLTVEDNLHTLCADCNLAKSDNRIEQMELWPKPHEMPKEIIQDNHG